MLKRKFSKKFKVDSFKIHVYKYMFFEITENVHIKHAIPNLVEMSHARSNIYELNTEMSDTSEK